MKLIEGCGHVPVPDPYGLATPDNDGKFIVITAMCKECFISHVAKGAGATTIVDALGLMSKEEQARVVDMGFAGYMGKKRNSWEDYL